MRLAVFATTLALVAAAAGCLGSEEPVTGPGNGTTNTTCPPASNGTTNTTNGTGNTTMCPPANGMV